MFGLRICTCAVYMHDALQVKRLSDPLGLALGMIVRCQVVAGNRTWIFYKCSDLPALHYPKKASLITKYMTNIQLFKCASAGYTKNFSHDLYIVSIME